MSPSNSVILSAATIWPIHVFSSAFSAFCFANILHPHFWRSCNPGPTLWASITDGSVTLADCCFYPVTKMGELINGFKVDHRSLESLGKSLEELLADHGFVDVIFSHSDHMFEICDIFVNVASFHLEGKNIPSCKIFTHVILECLGKVIDNHGPNPFVHISAPKCHVFSN